MEGMSAICPLNDEYLPIDAGSLKIKQVCLRLSVYNIHLYCLSPSTVYKALNTLVHIGTLYA